MKDFLLENESVLTGKYGVISWQASLLFQLFLWLPPFTSTPKAFPFLQFALCRNLLLVWSDPLRSQEGCKYSISRQSKCDTEDSDSQKEEWVKKYPEGGGKGVGLPLAGEWNEEIKSWWRGRWSVVRPAQGHSPLLKFICAYDCPGPLPWVSLPHGQYPTRVWRIYINFSTSHPCTFPHPGM